MILDILHALAGFAFGLFIPGYLITLTFFKELKPLEKITLGFILSVCLDIIVGLILGYNETTKNITGGITALNLWIALLSISAIFGGILIYRDHEKIRDFFDDIEQKLYYRKFKDKKSKKKHKKTKHE
ncbi:MAG: hypothetical protein ACLFPQ_05430 [Candidatus Woesearchaeota archaeon]